MNAPDKIYIQQDMINNLILEKQEFDDDVEYIRKDALLEWAKSVKADPIIPMNIDKVIAKIESL